mmetsp:Transcript_25196/g.41984  ORF Transcript_25196/g.41984 Transcript_25196/m.41984 type:complete len:312 (-) Transcript_25196:248-1183(-)
MQALQKKKVEEQKMRDMLASDETRTLEERVEHCRNLQYEQHKGIFAILHSSLHKAAADGSIDGIKYFLDKRKKPRVHIDDFDKAGLCAIHAAARNGRVHSIQYLVDNGCSVDLRSTYGDTALFYACKGNHLEAVSLLFNLGATITLTNKAGFTPIHAAAQADNVEALSLLVDLTINRKDDEDEGDGEDEESVASSAKTAEDNDSLLSGGKGPSLVGSDPEANEFLNFPSRNLTTPLHCACMSNAHRVVNFLLEQHVKLDLKDSTGDTALHKAGRQGYNVIFAQLKDAGASDKIKNNFGETPADLLVDNPQF